MSLFDASHSIFSMDLRNLLLFPVLLGLLCMPLCLITRKEGRQSFSLIFSVRPGCCGDATTYIESTDRTAFIFKVEKESNNTTKRRLDSVTAVPVHIRLISFRFSRALKKVTCSEHTQTQRDTRKIRWVEEVPMPPSWRTTANDSGCGKRCLEEK